MNKRKRINYKALWDRFATNRKIFLHIDPVLGAYKSEEFLNLVKKSDIELKGKKIFKTDLCEEALGEDQVLFSLTEPNMLVYASDISEKIVKKAIHRKEARNLCHNYLTADVRNIPFKDNVLDLILSTSTLDHFSTNDYLKRSLVELKRVMKPTGKMIIALNNQHNVNFFLMLKLAEFLRLKPYVSRFYTLHSFRAILEEIGLHVKRQDFAVHIISPANTILLLLRKFVAPGIVDKIAKIFVSVFRLIGSIKKSKILTGWFIVVECSK